MCWGPAWELVSLCASLFTFGLVGLLVGGSAGCLSDLNALWSDLLGFDIQLID